MKSVDEIKYLFEKHDGMMRTSELLEERVYYKELQSLIEVGVIEKVRYGYYQLTDNENFSEVTTVIRLFPDAIFCMETALYYYRYSDRTPKAWNLAVSKDSGKSRFKIEYPPVKPYYIEPSLLEIGLTNFEIDGNLVRIYDKERTICDCLRYFGKMDREIFNNAIRRYVYDPKKDISRLMEYAKKMRVVQKVNNIIGVWI